MYQRSASPFPGRSLIALSSLVLAAQVSGDVIFVDDAAPIGGDGLSWASAYQDLQDGLVAAMNGDEIWLAEGVYRPTAGADRTATFQLSSGVAVLGGFPAGGGDGTFDARDIVLFETILCGDLGENDTGDATHASRGDNSYHVVTSSGVDATAHLDGLTITGGNGDGGGNHNRGAGILNLGGNPLLVDCALSGNIADFGGGMFSSGASSPIFVGCSITDNVGRQQAGGVYSATGSNLTVINGSIRRNSSFGVAGGLYVQFDSTITNCVFDGNLAASNGGGLYAIVGRPVVSNCTFSGNDAASGGAMYAANGGSTQTSVLRNCIAWGNTPDQLVQGGNPIDVSYSNVQGGWAFGGTGNIDADPLFADGSNGDLHLLPGSPSVDAGLDSLVPPDTMDLDGDSDLTEPIPFDLDGNDRFHAAGAITDTTVDMGAYELNVLDSDGDGLSDSDELAIGTDPLDPDTDDDGLLDGEEIDLAGGTGCPDPLVADSDADGDLDGDEVDTGFDPCDASPESVVVVEQLTNIGSDAVVRLDGSGSTDVESPTEDLQFTWTIDGDEFCSGNFVSCGTIDVSLSYGTHVISLVVTDPSGGFDETVSTVTLDAAALSVFAFDRLKVDFEPASGTMSMKGEIGLPFGVDSSEVSPVALIGLSVAGVEALPVPIAPILFEVTGGGQNKWTYHDDQGILGVTRFDIDWKGSRFDFKEHGVPFSLKSRIITSSETVLSFKYRMDQIGGPFSLDIGNLASIDVDANGDVVANVPFEIEHEGREVTLTLPFPIVDDTVITASGAVSEAVLAGDHLKASIGRLRIDAEFDGAEFPDGEETTPRTFEALIFIGVAEYPALVSLGPDELRVKGHHWTKKNQ